MIGWDEAAPLLQGALDRSPGGFTLADVAQDIRDGKAQFWPGHRSACVTETGRNLNIWLYGGDASEVPAMLASGEAWARQTGHSTMTVFDARPGWDRLLARHGYTARRALMKDL